MTPRTRLVLAVLTACAALVVLYLIHARTVHAPPEALARLKLAAMPMAVPDVSFADAAGHSHALSSLRGRYVLLNLWAPWCAPCVRELPALARVSRTLPPARLTVIAVDVGARDDAKAAERFLAAHDASPLGVYLDHDFVLMRTFHAYGLPLTLLIDPQGREIARAVGPGEWDAPEAVAYLRSIVKSH